MVISERYELEVDDYNYTLKEIGVRGEDSKRPGEKYVKDQWYYGSLPKLRKGFKDKVLREAFKSEDSLYDIYLKFDNGLEQIEELLTNGM